MKNWIFSLTFMATAVTGCFSIPKLLNPHTRGMTPSEIKLAYGIFGNTINYGQITIHNGMKGVHFMRGQQGITLGEHIYCHDDTTSQNIANTADRGKINLMHELNHVHQQQTMLRFATGYAFSMYQAGMNYDALYNVTDNIKNFNDANQEQQSEIIESFAAHYLCFASNLQNLSHVRAVLKRNNLRTEKGVALEYKALLKDAFTIGDAYPLPVMKQVNQTMDDLVFYYAEEQEIVQAARQKYLPKAPTR